MAHGDQTGLLCRPAGAGRAGIVCVESDRAVEAGPEAGRPTSRGAVVSALAAAPASAFVQGARLKVATVIRGGKHARVALGAVNKA